MLSHDVMTVARWLAYRRRTNQPIGASEIDRVVENLGTIAAGVAVLEQQTVKPQVILDLDRVQLDGKIVPLHRPRPGGAS